MSVSLVSQPTGVKHCKECMTFVLSKTAPATGVQSFIAWQLFDGNDQPITQIEAQDPGTANYPIDVRHEVAKELFTEWPLPGAGVGIDTTLHKEFYLKYWEIRKFEEDGICETEEDSPEQSDNFRAIGSYPQYDDVLDFTEGVFLSKRPLRYYVCRDTEDYIWVYGAGEVTYTAYYADGSTDTAGVTFANQYVNIIALTNKGLADTFANAGLSKLKIEIELSSETRVYETWVKECCCDYDHTEVEFREPLGSYSTLAFDCVGGARVQWEGGIVCRGVICSPDSAPHPEGPLTIKNYLYRVTNKKSTLQLTLSRKFPSRMPATKWLSMLGSCLESYIWVKNTAGDRVRCVFLMPSGTATIAQKDDKFDFTVQGTIVLMD